MGPQLQPRRTERGLHPLLHRLLRRAGGTRRLSAASRPPRFLPDAGSTPISRRCASSISPPTCSTTLAESFEGLHDRSSTKRGFRKGGARERDDDGFSHAAPARTRKQAWPVAASVERLCFGSPPTPVVADPGQGGMLGQTGEDGPGERPCAHIGQRFVIDDYSPCPARNSSRKLRRLFEPVAPNQPNCALPIWVQKPFLALWRAPVSSTVIQAALSSRRARRLGLRPGSAVSRRSAGERFAASR